MIKEFDSIIAFNKKDLIWYFRNGIKPLIQVQTDKQGRNLDT